MNNLTTAKPTAIQTMTPAHSSSVGLNLEPHVFMDVQTATLYHLIDKKTGCAVAEWQMTNCHRILNSAFNRLVTKSFGYELSGWRLEVLQ